jgi:hypothetical protein
MIQRKSAEVRVFGVSHVGHTIARVAALMGMGFPQVTHVVRR